MVRIYLHIMGSMCEAILAVKAGFFYPATDKCCLASNLFCWISCYGEACSALYKVTKPNDEWKDYMHSNKGRPTFRLIIFETCIECLRNVKIILELQHRNIWKFWHAPLFISFIHLLLVSTFLSILKLLRCLMRICIFNSAIPNYALSSLK